ncbi:MAG: tetratricopeptide repeat protein [Bacteroidales bacterium]
MQRFTCLLSVFLFLQLSIHAQKLNVDSLKYQLTVSSQEEAVEIYLELSEYYQYENPDSALYFASMALDKAEAVSDEILIADSYSRLGSVYLNQYQVDESLQNLLKAREIYSRLEEFQDLSDVNIKISQIYFRTNDYEEALKYIQESLQLGEEKKNQKIRAEALFYLGRVYSRMNRSEMALESYTTSLEIWEDLGNEKEIATVLNSLGSYYSARADFENAIIYFKRTLEIRERLNDTRGVGIAMNNLGNQYLQLGNFDEAIRYYREASDIFKELNFDAGIAATLTGLAVIYENLKQYNSVLDVYKEVLEIRRKQNDKRELANTLSNIAVTYSKMLNDSLESIYGPYYQDTIYTEEITTDIDYGIQSVDHNLDALEIREEINDLRGVSITLANLGHVYQSMGEFEMANQYFSRWLDLPEEYKDEDTHIPISIGMGKLAMYEKDYNKAIGYFQTAYRLAQDINKKLHIREAARNLADIYEKTGNYELALQYFQRFHNVYDSLNQETTRQQINDLQVKYRTEAQEKENEILRKDQLIKEKELKNSRRALIATIIVLLIFAGLVIQLIRQNNLRKKANEELERKNALITEQTKEITDSIQYASRIQNAVLSPEEYLKKLLPQQFLIYRPRDIVSGDFYWITEKNNKILTIVADCTGHGVPGAFMSMLGIAFLNEIVSKHDHLTTDFILNELRKQVIDSLHQTGKEGESQDGMDISIYMIDKSTQELEYSGANNPLIIIRNGEMTELKADKMPIGIHTRVDKPFSKKTFQLRKGDMLYAFSDGYADQFGGPQGKKFMIKNFKKLLLKIHDLSLNEQKQILEKTLNDWMQDLNQIDDILVMGVRV